VRRRAAAVDLGMETRQFLGWPRCFHESPSAHPRVDSRHRRLPVGSNGTVSKMPSPPGTEGSNPVPSVNFCVKSYGYKIISVRSHEISLEPVFRGRQIRRRTPRSAAATECTPRQCRLAGVKDGLVLLAAFALTAGITSVLRAPPARPCGKSGRLSMRRLGLIGPPRRFTPWLVQLAFAGGLNSADPVRSALRGWRKYICLPRAAD
jgi:hypothetical protein